MRTVKLINAFGDRYQHSILAMDGRMTAMELIDKQVDVTALEPLPKAGSLATVRRLRKLLKRVSPDLLLTYNWGAFDAVMAARSLFRKNIVHHEDGFTPDELNGFIERRIKARKLFLPKVSSVIVPSKNLRRIALKNWALRPELVTHIANGVDLDAFEPHDGRPELRARLGIPEDAVVIGSVGHLRPEKNFARLINASRTLCAERNAHVVLLGEGPEQAALEALASEPSLAGHVHLVGHQSEPAEWYQLFDLYCISSDTEQMPVSLLEAMASELPVAATEVGDIRDVLPGEQAGGLVVIEDDEARTVENLSAALTRFLEDPEETSDLGRANRERVTEAFTFEKMLASYRDIWDRGLGL